MKPLLIFLLILPVIGTSQIKEKKITANLKITVRDQETDQTLANSSVKIIGTNNLSIEKRTNKKGLVWVKKLPKGYKFIFECSREGCLGNKGQISTKELQESRDFIIDVYLICGGHPIIFPDFDFEKDLAVLDSIHVDSIRYMYDLMIENPTIIVNIEVKYFLGKSKKTAIKRGQTIISELVQKGIPKNRLFITTKNKARRKKVGENTIDNIKIISWDYIPEEE